MNGRHYENRQTSAESAGGDPGLLYRPIRFRGISPAGLYRGAPTERQRARPSPSPTQPPSHPRTSGQGWRSPVTAVAPPKVSTSTTSRSVFVLVDYVPTKLRWRSEEPVHTHGGVLSAARPSTPTLVGSQRLGEPCIRAPSIDPHIVTSPRFSLRSQAPVREYFQPSLRYALFIVETLEVEARAAIVTDESTEFGSMIQRFRHAVAMEVVRVAAFQLFRLERRARASVCEQEFRERAIIDFWQRDSLQDIQLRNSLEWNWKTGTPAGAPITVGTENSWIPTDSIRHEKAPTPLMSRPGEHSCPVSLRWSKTSSSSRASPPSIRGSAPRDSTQRAVVCDEGEIGDATHLLRTRSSGVLYPEVEYTPQLCHQSVDVSLNNGALHPVSTEVRLNEGNMNSLQSLTTTLLQEQRLDAKIARQRASYLTRMDSQLVSQRLARTRDLSDRALQDRLTLLFD